MKVAELWRYPVKSLRGEQLDRVRIEEAGIAGDRRVRVVNDGRHISARSKRGLLGLRATTDVRGTPLVEGRAWDTPAALAALRAVVGENSALVRDETLARFDDAPVLVVTDGALAALGEDRRRFRPNVVVEDVPGLQEQEWLGHALRIGEAKLVVRDRCERCVVTTIDPTTLELRPDVLRRVRDRLGGTMGVLCDVTVPGEVAVGDPVDLA